MEIDEGIDFDEHNFHPNKLVALWYMADFMRRTVEELIAKEGLQKPIQQHQTTADDDAFAL